jgi:hypothetical protein
MLWQVIKIFLRLFFLKAKPEDLPYSRVLLVILCCGLLLVKTISNIWLIDIISVYDPKLLIDINYLYAAFIFGIYLFILFASVLTTLSFYKVPERSVQVITAFVSMDLLLGLLFMVWVSGLALVPLPLQANSIAGLFLILYFVVMLYWQFMLYIHIIFNSLNLTVLLAGVYALVYMLLQHNVAEILIGLVIKVSEQ